MYLIQREKGDYMKRIIMIIGIVLLSVSGVNAGVINGYFEGGTTGWSKVGTGGLYCGDPGFAYGQCSYYVAYSGTVSQDIDFTNTGVLLFTYWMSGAYPANVYIGGVLVKTLNVGNGCYDPHIHSIDTSGLSGVQTLTFEANNTGQSLFIDNVNLLEIEPHTFYFKDDCGNMFKDGTLNTWINNTDTGLCYLYNANPIVFEAFTHGDNIQIHHKTALSDIIWNTVGVYAGQSDFYDTIMQWDLDITCRHVMSSDILPNTKVDMSFGCRADGSPATATGYTDAQGKIKFYDVMSQ